MPKIDCTQLAEAIAERLAVSLPATVHLKVDGPSLSTFGPDGLYGWYDLDQMLSWDDDGQDDDGSQAELWVSNVLSDIQDDVAHATRGLAWPPRPAGTAEPLPMPWAEVRNKALHLGYGKTELRPIALRDISPQK